MATTEDVYQIFNLTNELNQNVAKQQAEANAKNMRETVEKQTEATQQILEALTKQLEKATKNSKRKKENPDEKSDPTQEIFSNQRDTSL